jgi:hypothetical protein
MAYGEMLGNEVRVDGRQERGDGERQQEGSLICLLGLVEVLPGIMVKEQHTRSSFWGTISAAGIYLERKTN